VSVVTFEDLQALSGYRQQSKVIAWAREQGLKFVVGGDGLPRTTTDYLAEVFDGTEATQQATPVLFGR
jgi:hypothetical protein